MTPDEQVAVLEQITDLLFDPLLAAGGTPGGPRAGTAPPQLGGVGRQAFAELGHGTEDRLGEFLEDVHHPNAIGTLRRIIVIPFRSMTRRFISHLSNRSWPEGQ